MVTELTCSAALMVANLSIKQPWHTEYCHLSFEYSRLNCRVHNAVHAYTYKELCCQNRSAPDTVVGYKLKVLSWFILVVKPFPFLLLTTYYLPLITYYLLLTTYYLPPITYYFPFPHPNQSFPFAYNIRPSKRTIPTTCAYSKNLSLGFLPVIISIRVKTRLLKCRLT